MPATAGSIRSHLAPSVHFGAVWRTVSHLGFSITPNCILTYQSSQKRQGYCRYHCTCHDVCNWPRSLNDSSKNLGGECNIKHQGKSMHHAMNPRILTSPMHLKKPWNSLWGRNSARKKCEATTSGKKQGRLNNAAKNNEGSQAKKRVGVVPIAGTPWPGKRFFQAPSQGTWLVNTCLRTFIHWLLGLLMNSTHKKA